MLPELLGFPLLRTFVMLANSDEASLQDRIQQGYKITAFLSTHPAKTIVAFR